MKRLALLMVFCCCFGGLLFADGGAEREITAAEKAFYGTTYLKVTDLLPQAPAGLERKIEELNVPRSMGVGAENYPIQYTIDCDYTKLVDQQAQMEMAMSMANDADGMAAMNEQITRISEELQAAVAKGDQQQMAQLQKKMQDVIQGNTGIQKLKKNADEHEKASFKLWVGINTNGADFWPYREIPAPANTGLAIRRDKTENSGCETVLFFGPYSKKVAGEKGDTLQIYAERKKADSTKIHYLMITIQGEPEVVDPFIASMNLAGFAALLK